MTAESRDGRDKPFCDWLRLNRGLDSYTISLYSCDIDQIFCKYKTSLDGQGTRDIKCMMEIEIKTFGAKPDNQQAEVLYFKHQLMNRKGWFYSNLLNKKITLWHFGQYVLQILDGARPDDCSGLNWGKFEKNGELRFYPIKERHLIRLLKFNVNPNTFEPISFRRHHKVQKIEYLETRGLLFPQWRTITKRS